MDEMDVKTELEWGPDWCKVTKGDRTLRVTFPAHERFVATQSLTGAEYPIPDNMRRHLKGLPVIDIGAHVGATLAYWAIELAPRVILAYEPDLRNHEYLTPNTDEIGNVCGAEIRISLKAVSDKTASGVPFYRGESTSLSSLVRTPKWCKVVDTVNVNTVSGLRVLQCVDGAIGVLKIDAEESEAEILSSMQPELHRCAMVYVEHHGEDLRRECDRILGECGFMMVHSECRWTHGSMSYVNEKLAREMYDAEDWPHNREPKPPPQYQGSGGISKEVADAWLEATKSHAPPWCSATSSPRQEQQLANEEAGRLVTPRQPPEDNPPPQFKVMFARFPGGGMDRKEVTDWQMSAVLAAKEDPRISNDILFWNKTDTPITMVRNECMEIAKKEGADFVVMVDNDMSPDLYLPSNIHREYSDPKARPFFQTSFDFALKQRLAGEPCCIAAPYCGPPPHENMYVFHWQRRQNDCPQDEADMILDMYPREHAVTLKGIQEAAALPTGLILIDMQCLQYTDPPYFYYEWEDETESKKASTEDVTFTRNLSLNGCPQFCNWDAWAGHFKLKCVGRPKTLSARSLNPRFKRRVLEEYNILSPQEEMVILKRQESGNGKKARCAPCK